MDHNRNYQKPTIPPLTHENKTFHNCEAKYFAAVHNHNENLRTQSYTRIIWQKVKHYVKIMTINNEYV